MSANQHRFALVTAFGWISLIAAGSLVPVHPHRGDVLLILLGMAPSALLFWWWKDGFEWPGMVRRSVYDWLFESSKVRRWTGLFVVALITLAFALGLGWLDPDVALEGKTSRLWLFAMLLPLAPGMIAEWRHRYQAIGAHDAAERAEAQRIARERAARRADA